MLASLDQSAFAQWLLGSNSIWAYPTVLTLHTFGMMVLVGAALMVDLRLLGFGRSIPLGSMRRLFGVMWGAFWLNLVTGTMLFIADATKRATQPLFIINRAWSQLPRETRVDTLHPAPRQLGPLIGTETPGNTFMDGC